MASLLLPKKENSVPRHKLQVPFSLENDFKREFRPQFDLKIGKPYGRRPGGTLRHTTGEADAPEAGANGGPSDPENQPVTCRPVMRMPEASRTGPAEKERRMGGTQTWRFQVAGGLVGRKSLPLQEHIDFWPEKGQEWLRGYVVAENTRGTLWGRRIDFHLEVQPFAEPIDLLARPDEPKPGRRPHRRLKDPEKQAYIERVEARLAALRAQFPRPADRALEERCLAHLGNDRLILPMAEAFAAGLRIASLSQDDHGRSGRHPLRTGTLLYGQA